MARLLCSMCGNIRRLKISYVSIYFKAISKKGVVTDFCLSQNFGGSD